MGDYTGLRFSAELRDDAVPIVKRLNEIMYSPGEYERTGRAPWQSVAEQFHHPVLDLWSRVERCNQIPFGAVMYMPSDCSTGKNSILEGRQWTVTCSLKDPRVIHLFLEFVLPYLIKESTAAEVLFEGAMDLEEYKPTYTAVEPKALPPAISPARRELEAALRRQLNA